MLARMIRAAPPAVAAFPLIAVTASDETVIASAQVRARELCLPFAADGARARFSLLLVQTPTHLELRDSRNNETVCVRIKPADLARARVPRREPLARALGKARTVVDATAGLGRDSVLIACMGYRVIALERSAPVAALLRDGVQRAVAAGLLAEGRIEARHADACAALPALAPRPDVVYLDPMFPPKRKKSAAARKELRLLRALVGDDVDAVELLAASLACAARVVVKRPVHAPPLGPRPSATYGGKLVRYDVYRGAGSVKP